MNKTSIILAVCLFLGLTASAQVSISPAGNSTDPSAGLDVNFNNKGFLQPRLTGEQILAIEDPATGLMVYNLSSDRPVFFDGMSWRNFNCTAAWFGCGNPLEITHQIGLAAPVNKTVRYGTVSNVPGETSKCWITSNLGSDRQATAVNDATEASAGWYWQFNRRRGFKHDGTTRTPDAAWTNYISENSNWLPLNDPCALELGKGWRIPTNTEMSNVDIAGNWSNWNGPWNSSLKLHAAGHLLSNSGNLSNRGVFGRYWSSTGFYQYDKGYYMGFGESSCAYGTDSKSYGMPVRCINPCVLFLSTIPAPGIHIVIDTAITWRWLPVEGASGYRWNTVNNFYTSLDIGGNFVKTETGLSSNTLYTRYVWAYNECGNSTATALTATTATSGEWTCGELFLVSHVADTVAPVNKTVIYGTVFNIPGEPDKCWITSNLGADCPATSVNDAAEATAGWYWQFNREQGFKHDGTTRTPNTFWIDGIDENSGWLSSNDPCAITLGLGWRIPLKTEWTNISTAGSWTNWNGPWNSALKMHAGGWILPWGNLDERGVKGNFWSSTQYNATQSYHFGFAGNTISNDYYFKSCGYSVRCINSCVSLPSNAPDPGVNIVVDTAITWRWLAVTGAYGYLWNTVDDAGSAMDVGKNLFKTEAGLEPDSSYTRYVWAYNACGNSASSSLSASTTMSGNWACGNAFLVIHHADTVAAVDKTVIYGTVPNIPGETDKCWITSNLGADCQATSVDDATETSAGWYWQFNREQGFKYEGTTRTPNTAWVTSINENSDWLPSHDPCALELGILWRIPTSTEWTNIDNGGNWTDWNGPWNSGLKIHAAGYFYTDGNFYARGVYGRYWSSKQSGTANSFFLSFISNSCVNADYSKSYGFSVRCISTCISLPDSPPTPGDHVVFDTAIVWKWMPVAGADGYRWNTTDDYNSALEMGTGTSKLETGLEVNTSYTRYVWAYNECGQTASSVYTVSTVQWICGNQILVIHDSDMVAPVGKTVIYGTVTTIPGETGKCWITSNLGSDRQAIAVNDSTEASAGWYWQFNRKRGYKHEGGTNIIPAWSLVTINENLNWTSSEDPCLIEMGTGWRLPTNTEWSNVDASGGWTTWTGPWNSGLKLHAAGYILNTNGQLEGRNGSTRNGWYWSSSQENNSKARMLMFDSGLCYTNFRIKNYGHSVRCIKE